MFYPTINKRLSLMESRQRLAREQSPLLQLLEPIQGFSGMYATLYKVTHPDELDPMAREWYGEEEPDPVERSGILIELMVKTEDPRTRHKLLVEMLEAIPDEIAALEDLVTLVPSAEVAGLQKQITWCKHIYAGYCEDKRDLRWMLDIVHANRSRWLGEEETAH